MTSQYDAIVIGSGHNGLTCACYLAKAGMKVLVLEQYASIGGMTNTEELTLPGFHSDTHAIGYQLANISPVPRELGLHRFGFELLHPEICFSHVFPDGTSISVFRDIERSCDSIARFSNKDADVWRTLCSRFAAESDQIAAALNSLPPSPAEQMRVLEDLPDGLDEYRFQLQSFRSWARETFAADRTKLLLGSWCCHVGLSPDDAGGASVAWMFCGLIQQFGNNVVKGGMRNLPLALAGFLEAHGGAVRTHAKVDKILIEKGRAVAVRLSDGETIDVGELVASNVDPQQLVLGLLGEEVVGSRIAGKMRHYELGESVLVIYLALDRPVHYKAGALAGRGLYAHPSAVSLDAFSRQFHECRSGLLPARPFALLCNDSAADPSRVPAGKALMKLVVQPVPYAITGDAGGTITGTTWQEVKEPYADRVIDQLTEDYIPELRDNIACRVVHSSVDLETLLPSTPHGTITHGAFLPYQIGAMRPIPEIGRYRSPVGNVYLCGSGSHPGAGVSMAPGRNAAQVIYCDLSLAFPSG
jgi:beta-carotene ketolase (CrtO type)